MHRTPNMARLPLPSEAERCSGCDDGVDRHALSTLGKRRAGVARVELMRKRERRETVPDGCGGAGGMAERIRKKEVRGRSNGMGQRFHKSDRIWAERISYCFNCFS